MKKQFLGREDLLNDNKKNLLSTNQVKIDVNGLKKIIDSYDGTYSNEENVYIETIKIHLNSDETGVSNLLCLTQDLVTKLAEAHVEAKNFAEAEKCFWWVQHQYEINWQTLTKGAADNLFKLGSMYHKMEIYHKAKHFYGESLSVINVLNEYDPPHE